MHWCFPCLPTISNSLSEQFHYSFTFLSSHSRFLNPCHTKAEPLGMLSTWNILDPEEFIISRSNLFKSSLDLLLRPSIYRSDFTRLRCTAASSSCLVSWPEAKYLLQDFTGLLNLHRERGNLTSSFYIMLCIRTLTQ